MTIICKILDCTAQIRRNSQSGHVLAAVALAMIYASAGAAAAVSGTASNKIASFTTVHGGLQWVNLGLTRGGNDGVDGQLFTTFIPGHGSGHAGVSFSFGTGSGISGVNNIAAWFQLNGVVQGTPATYVLGGSITQTNINNGTYSFTAIAPGTSSAGTYAAGTVLLYGTFAKAEIVGTNGGLSMIFQDTAGSGGVLTMLSPLATFSGPFSFSISKPVLNTPLVALPGAALSSFDPAIAGSFGSGTGAVPEPASWAMMISGFGMVGATLRRRRADGQLLQLQSHV